MRYFIVTPRFKTDNTAEYGFGDYSDRVDFINLVVEADTKRKAINKAKKIDNRLIFGGAFGSTAYADSELPSDLKGSK